MSQPIESSESNLVNHARREFELAGYFEVTEDKFGDEMNQEMAKNVLELLETFAKQGHSGFSAGFALSLFSELARFKILSPLSSDPSTWMEVGPNVWQSTRCPSVFSRDGGKTWYDLDGVYNNGDSIENVEHDGGQLDLFEGGQ